MFWQDHYQTLLAFEVCYLKILSPDMNLKFKFDTSIFMFIILKIITLSRIFSNHNYIFKF